MTTTRNALAKSVLSSAAGELAAAVPGGSTALSVVQHIFTSRTKSRAEELFKAIGVHLGVDDWEQAAAQLSVHVGKPWFDEAIETGFLELMSATDADARVCIGALVAEYVVNKKSPDLKFKRVGALLRDADGKMLPTLWAMATSYMSILPKAGRGMRVLVRSIRRPETPEQYWIGMYPPPPSDATPVAVPATMRESEYKRPQRSVIFSEHFPMVENFQECARALVGAGIGNLWSGLSDSALEGEPVIYWENDEDQVLALLTTCLQTWLARKQQTSHSATPSEGA